LVFRVRAGRDGLSPSQRADAIRARLTAAVGRRDAAADSVRLLSTPQGIEVRLGSQFLWLVSPADVEGIGPAALAAEVVDLPAKVQEGILKERAGRRPIGILLSIVMAFGISVAAWLVARLLLVLDRRWRAWLAGTLPRHLKSFRVRGFEVLSQTQMVGLGRSVIGLLDLAVGLLLLYAYVTLVLSLFPWTQGWSWHLWRIAIGGLLEVARTLVSAVPGLLMIGVVVVVFRWLIGLSDRFFDSIAAGSVTFGGFHRELALPSRRIVRILLWISALIVAYPYIPGGQSKAVQGVSLLVGLMVSIGSTGFVGNIIAGIVLTYARSFRVGERVRIGDHVGDITNLGFFATKLRTIRNEELTLPNGLVAASAITNYTRLAEEHGLVLHTEVTIGYNVDWRKVHAMLIEAAGRVADVQKDPAPRVFQRSLNDYHVSYELNCVTRLSHPQLRLYSDLHQEIQDVFAREGVEILSPGFQALRDANAPVLPQEPAGPRAQPFGFRVLPGDS
jgi:small-conductance mechanosensitive channel